MPAATVRHLGTAFALVQDLNTLAQTLVNQKAALNESLNNAQVALGNVQNTYNAAGERSEAFGGIGRKP